MFDPKIAVSGAAGGGISKEGEKYGFIIGQQLAVKGAIVMTGATTGVPYAAVKGAKMVGGQTIGLSPAHSLREHVNKYKLPVDYHDFMFFTGYDYAGRDTLLIDLADAVISVSGRIGSLHEFTTAFERNKIIGVLLNSGGMADEIPELLDKAQRGMGRVILHDDPAELVSLVIEALEEENHFKRIHKSK